MKSGTRIARRVLLAALLIGAGRSPAAASTFTVNPTQVALSAQTSSRLVTLRNQSQETLRFQVSTFFWSQTPQGEMVLAPTRDVVVFPSLLTLAAGEERRIRVGFTGPIGATEVTYRIFVEELPPSSPVISTDRGVRVLTRMGIPVFIQPSRPMGRIELTAPQLQSGRLSFALRNTGNVHVLPRNIKLRGTDTTGAVVLEQSVPGWYVLADSVRNYEFELPAASCPDLASLSVHVQVGDTTLEERLTSAGGCGR